MPTSTLHHPPFRSRLARAIALALPAALAACHDAPVAPRPAAPEAAAPTLAVTCRASVRDHAVTCGAPAGGAGVSGALVLGGQGVYVLLSSTNVAYDAATGVFSADVRVRNLTAQQLGTADGSTATGIKVFFQSGPSVSAGTGAVSVANADGTGTFLGAGQPYFDYPQFLEPQDSTAKKTWRFSVPATVDRFVFEVYVQAEVPAERSVLRWVNARPVVATQTLGGVWAASATDAFAVGFGGAIAHYDGARWSRMSSPVTYPLRRVAGRSGTDVFAVGDGGVLHWDGSAWSKQLQTGAFAAVWAASGSGDAFAVGPNGAAQHYDGSGWVTTPTGTGSNLNGVWGTSASNVYAVGDGDVLLRWNGSDWSAFGSGTGTGENLTDVWGTSASDLWVTTAGGALLHYDGATWTTRGTTNGVPLRAVSGSATEVYAVGDAGTALRWNGSLATLTRPAIAGLRGAAALAGGGAIVSGDQGTIAQFDGTSWTVQENAGTYTGVWGSGSTDVFAVSTAGLVAHWDGSAWRFMRAPVVASLRSVAGSGPSDVYAGGDGGSLLHYDGSGWSTLAATSTGALPVVALWTPGVGTLFAATSTTGPTYDVIDPNARITRWVNGSVAQSTAGYSARALWGTSASAAFAAGDSAEVAQWDGSAWSGSLPRNSFASLFGLWGSSDSDVYAVGDYTIRHWNGAAWTKSDFPNVAFKGVWGSGPADIFAVGDAGAVWHYNGTRWNAQFPGTNASLTGVWGTGPLDVYAVGASGTLLHGIR